jgi:hypothetical protein
MRLALSQWQSSRPFQYDLKKWDERWVSRVGRMRDSDGRDTNYTTLEHHYMLNRSAILLQIGKTTKAPKSPNIKYVM